MNLLVLLLILFSIEFSFRLPLFGFQCAFANTKRAFDSNALFVLNHDKKIDVMYIRGKYRADFDVFYFIDRNPFLRIMKQEFLDFAANSMHRMCIFAVRVFFGFKDKVRIFCFFS